MKIFVISDIHGKLPALETARQRAEEEQPDLVVCCGDFLNHGPRNGIPEGYDPPGTAALLNRFFTDRLLCVRGNCDSEVDQMLLDFPCLQESAAAGIPAKNGAVTRIFFHHGHKEFPAPPGCVVVSGHTHIPLAEWRGGTVFLNPGSISIPKGGSPASYAVLYSGKEQGLEIEVKPLDGRGGAFLRLSVP